MLYIYIENLEHNKRIQYVFDTIFYILGIKYEYVIETDSILNNGENLIIKYVDDIKDLPYKNSIIIKNSNKLFGNNYMCPKSIPTDIKMFPIDINDSVNSLISIFHDNDELYIRENLYEKSVITNIDFISDIFFMLTRYEEIIDYSSTIDNLGRYESNNSLAYKHGFLNRPIVNEYIELLWKWIQRFNVGIKRKNWWNEFDFAACLTHDVDNIVRFKSVFNLVKGTAGVLIKRRSIKKGLIEFMTGCKSLVNSKNDPYYTFEYIMHEESNYNYNSSFYIMTGGTSKFDNNYKVKDNRVIELIKQFESSGFEVGIHGSFNSYNDEKLLLSEKKLLDDVVSEKRYGGRQHYLRFQVPYTWEIYNNIGIMYDATLSFHDHEGFRCGICHPYKPYNVLNDKIIDIWEIPLVVMETSLFGGHYRNMSSSEALDVIKNLIDTVKLYNGVFTLLWHNSSFSYGYKDWKRVFEQTLAYLNQANAIGLSGYKLIKIFKEG